MDVAGQRQKVVGGALGGGLDGDGRVREAGHDGVDLGDPEDGSSDAPDAEDLLEVIADTAGELEEHLSALSASLDMLRPYLPTASAATSERGDGVRA